MWTRNQFEVYAVESSLSQLLACNKPNRSQISRMSIYKPTSSDIVTQAFVEHCCWAYQMDHNGYHGFDHWMRVLYNGRLLAGMENANIRVVELFCLLHDTQRRNERRDPSHGRRAARYARSLRGVWFDISDEEMNLLTEALKYHSDGYTRADITVQVCWVRSSL